MMIHLGLNRDNISNKEWYLLNTSARIREKPKYGK